MSVKTVIYVSPSLRGIIHRRPRYLCLANERSSWVSLSALSSSSHAVRLVRCLSGVSLRPVITGGAPLVASPTRVLSGGDIGYTRTMLSHTEHSSFTRNP